MLFFIDSLDGAFLDALSPTQRQSAQVSFVCVGISAEAFQAKHQHTLKQFNRYRFIHIKTHAKKANEQVNAFVPEFIYALPKQPFFKGKSLFDLLQRPGYNLWWLTKFSEKGPLSCRFIGRLYYLCLLSQVLTATHYDQLVLCLHDQPLTETIQQHCAMHFPALSVSNRSKAIRKKSMFKALLKIPAQLGNELLKAFFLRKASQVDSASRPSDVTFFTFFPYFWKPTASGKQEELFFRGLPEALCGSHRVSFLAWFSGGLKSAFQFLGQKVDPSIRFNLLQASATASIALRMLSETAIYLFKMLRYRFTFRARIRAKMQDIDISPLVRAECDDSLYQFEPLKCVFMYHLIQAHLSAHPTRMLMYRAEFQPFERALLYAAQNRCRTFGFQHQVIARNHLQYQFAENEIALAFSSRSHTTIPFPAHCITTGDYAYETFQPHSQLPNRYLQCGPLRYARLLTESAPTQKRLPVDELLLVASPVTENDAINFAHFLGKACARLNPKLRIEFKSHPVVKFDALIQRILDAYRIQQRVTFLPDDIPFYEKIKSAVAILMTGTTLGVEALYLGTLPIIFDAGVNYSVNPLLEITRSCATVHDADELVRLLEKLLQPEALLPYQSFWEADLKWAFSAHLNHPTQRLMDALDSIEEGAPCFNLV